MSTEPLAAERNPTSRLGGPRPRLAFLVDWLEDPYQAAVLRGALDIARSRDVTLVAFPGGVLEAPHRNGKFRNHVYELVHNDHYDGVISMTGTLANHVGLLEFERFQQRFEPLPMCSIAVEVPGHSSVLVDNQVGIEAAIEHLITVHGHRKIGFIRGPEANSEAQLRYQAYLQALQRHGLECDERLVYVGDFQREGGRRAIETLFDEREVTLQDIDALAGAQDLMLLGAQKELLRRGVGIPEQLALIGFDDVEEARWVSPPLASVGQPLSEQGRVAVGMLLRQMTGGSQLERAVLKTELLPRASCGCRVEQLGSPMPAEVGLGRFGLRGVLIQHRTRLKVELTRAARGTFGAAGRDWEERLLNALLDTTEGRGDAFFSVFDQLLNRQLAAGGALDVGHALIDSLKQQLLLLCPDDSPSLRTLVGLFDTARLVVGKVAERAQAQRRLTLEAYMRVMTDASAQLVSASSLEALARVACEQLPKLGVRSFYLARYLDEARTRAQLVVAYGPWGRLEPGKRVDFEPCRLVPEQYVSYREAVQFMVEPLFHEAEPLGFAVFDLSEREGYTYEVLRELLSSALYRLPR